MCSELNERDRTSHLLNGVVCDQDSTSDAERRRINSAIYAELVKSETPHLQQHLCASKRGSQQSIKQNDGSTADLEVKLSNISVNADECQSFRTYCKSLSSITPSLTSTKQTNSSTRVVRRCRFEIGDQPEVERYTLSVRDTVHNKSHSTSLLSRNDSNVSVLSRKSAYADWLEKKGAEIRRQRKVAEDIELDKMAEAKRRAAEKMEHERQERENFLLWSEKKKQEDIYKRKIAEKELELERQLKKNETKAAVVQEIYLRQWRRRKQKAQKARKQENELKIKQHEEEVKIRQIESRLAFALWQKNSKSRPKPATQGLLPHQRATPKYINPIPWIMDDTTLTITQDSTEKPRLQV